FGAERSALRSDYRARTGVASPAPQAPGNCPPPTGPKRPVGENACGLARLETVRDEPARINGAHGGVERKGEQPGGADAPGRKLSAAGRKERTRTRAHAMPSGHPEITSRVAAFARRRGSPNPPSGECGYRKTPTLWLDGRQAARHREPPRNRARALLAARP